MSTSSTNFIPMKITKKVTLRRMAEKTNLRRITKLKRLKTRLRNVFAKFDFGISGGILRSSLDLSAPFTYFPARKMSFTWRGRESHNGKGEIHFGMNDIAYLDFVCKT